MLVRSTGRLLWPDTDTAKIPTLCKMPGQCQRLCPAGGCTSPGTGLLISKAPHSRMTPILWQVLKLKMPSSIVAHLDGHAFSCRIQPRGCQDCQSDQHSGYAAQQGQPAEARKGRDEHQRHRRHTGGHRSKVQGCQAQDICTNNKACSMKNAHT